MDPITGAALISGGSSLLGGLFGSRSTAKENAKDRAFNAQQAEINRNYQTTMYNSQVQTEERLANSAVQRHAADLEAAGFNRILAAGGQGAATPSVSAPSGSAASSHGNDPGQSISRGFEAAVSSAINAWKTGHENKMLDATAKKGAAEAAISEGIKQSAIDLNKSTARRVKAEADSAEAKAAYDKAFYSNKQDKVELDYVWEKGVDVAKLLAGGVVGYVGGKLVWKVGEKAGQLFKSSAKSKDVIIDRSGSGDAVKSPEPSKGSYYNLMDGN